MEICIKQGQGEQLKDNSICAFYTFWDIFVLGLLLLVTVSLVRPQMRTEFRQLGQIEILCAWRCDS